MTGSFAHSLTAAAERVASEIREARSANSAVRIRGAGSWMDAGGPVAADRSISVADDSGVVEFVPGDLTLTVLAGTSLATIAEVCAREKQWLALDPLGSAAGTIGATVATGSYGPLAHSFGAPRDHVLGVEFVTGIGDTVRGGGRVTKNVAGFDLTRLMCGAWGTLGILTELTVRLRGLPEVDRTLIMECDSNPSSLSELLRRFRASGVSVAALELVDSSWCSELSISAGAAIVARVLGNEKGVNVQLSRLSSLAPVEERDSDIWRELRESDSWTWSTFRMSSRPSLFPEVWAAAVGLSKRLPGSRSVASLGRGVVRCCVPGEFEMELGEALSERARSGIIFERLPRSQWRLLAPPEEVADDLTRRVRMAFDPDCVLNPGILGERCV